MSGKAMVWHYNDSRKPSDAVYVGRANGYMGRWGNPIRVGMRFTLNMARIHGWEPPYPPDMTVTRPMAISGYKVWVLEMMHEGHLDIGELKGKDLVCWCKPLICHGDVLLELANGPQEAQPELFDTEGLRHDVESVH